MHNLIIIFCFATDPPELDTGSRYMMCGRRVDVLKLWTAWKTRGEDGLERDVDAVFALASAFCDKIRAAAPRFDLVLDAPQSLPPRRFRYAFACAR
jgi:hypothetical protein